MQFQLAYTQENSTKRKLRTNLRNRYLIGIAASYDSANTLPHCPSGAQAPLNLWRFFITHRLYKSANFIVNQHVRLNTHLRMMYQTKEVTDMGYGYGYDGYGYDGGGPSILHRISPGVRVDVVFDHTGPRGVQATFLGFERCTALFLVDGEVLYIQPRKIQAISLHSPRTC